MAEPPLATPDYASACLRVGDFDVTYLTAEPPRGAVDGEPETVVLLHGFGAWAEVVWSRVIPRLAERYRVIAPDLLGFGLSSKPGEAFYDREDPLEPEVRFLTAFLDAVGVEKAAFVGNSFGGGVALQLAATHPERVTRLVLSNTMGLGRGIHFVYKALAMPLLGPLLLRPDRTRIRRMWEYVVHDPACVTDAVVERNHDLLSAPGAAETLAAARLGVNLLGQKIHLRDLAPQVQQPTLLVWGRQDRIFPLRQATRARKRFPHAELVVLDPCGHVPPFEAPARFNAALMEFLDRPLPRSGLTLTVDPAPTAHPDASGAPDDVVAG